MCELVEDKVMQFAQRVGVNNRADEGGAGALQLEFRTDRQIRSSSPSLAALSPAATELAARPTALKHRTDVLHTLISIIITEKKKKKKV